MLFIAASISLFFKSNQSSASTLSPGVYSTKNHPNAQSHITAHRAKIRISSRQPRNYRKSVYLLLSFSLSLLRNVEHRTVANPEREKEQITIYSSRVRWEFPSSLARSAIWRPKLFGALPNQNKRICDSRPMFAASSVLRMLHHSFGQSLFEEALHNYLDAHKYKTARPEYLVAAIQAQLDKEVGASVLGKAPPGNLEVNVATVINSWITQAGYPVVNASRNADNSVLLSQVYIYIVLSTTCTI